MKKLLLLTFTLAAFTLYAQDINWGAKAGLNFANMTGDDAEGTDARTSIHLGVTAEIAISDVFSIQPELLYSGQGYKADSFIELYDDNGNFIDEVDADLTAKVNYLSLPIMAKFYVSDAFSLEAGPQISFLMSAKGDFEGGGSSEEVDFKDALKSTDFALNLGAGYKLDSGLNFSLRYSIGMTDVPDGDSDGFKHSVLQLSVGYNF
tara:strand:- start:182 stop:799 length:618 start_codon:yes stop_codon:yes gene_type:complete